MSGLESFYNRYHLKNHRYGRVIRQQNFTYFYILQTLQKAFKTHFAQPYQTRLATASVLDVGCGVGTLALYFSQFAQRVTGLDVSSRAIEIARKAQRAVGAKNVTFRRAELQAERDHFDLVICTEVIEHIADDADFLRQLSKRLHKQGLLLLTTPSRENALYRTGFYQQFDAEVGHLRRYTAKGLARLLKKNGFRVLLLRQVEGPLRNLLFTTRLGFLIRFIRGPLIPVFHWLDMLTVKLFGASDLQVVAVKEF